MKIRTVGTELFHKDREKDAETEGQADMTKIIVAFRNSTKTLKNVILKTFNSI